MMQLDFAIGALRLAAAVALLGLCACATTGGNAAGTAGSAAPEGQEAVAAGLRGPIEARGPATAGAPEETQAAAPAPAAPPVRFLDRERDRWYYYDEQRQIYRWDNGEPKR